MAVMKIVVAGDSHMNTWKLKKLKLDHPDASLFLLTGDSEAEPQDLEGWISVRGNMDDYDESIPLERVIPLKDHSIYLCHGHSFGAFGREEKICQTAREHGCDIALYGHTHIPKVEQKEDVLLLNPGALTHPRSGSKSSYALLYLDLDTGQIQVEQKDFLLGI